MSKRTVKTKLLLIGAVALLVLTFGAAFGRSAVRVAAATQTVTISNFQFTPAQISIAVGDTVMWTNTGPSVHTSSSDTAGQWDSGQMAVNATFSQTFATAGTFNYHCNIHPTTMMGTITVAQAGAAPAAAPAQASPAAQATAAPAPPDMTKFGYTNVAGTVNFTPGQATNVTGGALRADLPADLISKPIKFELLTGDNATFQPVAGGRTVIGNYAFRVTDPATSQLVATFDSGKAVTVSFTGAAVRSDTAILNVSPTNPLTAALNSGANTIEGQTIKHAFTGTTVGWLVVNPAGAAAAAAAPVAAAAAAVPAALPRTGTGGPASSPVTLIIALVLAGIALGGAGLTIARRR
jgi:plastocyanin